MVINGFIWMVEYLSAINDKQQETIAALELRREPSIWVTHFWNLALLAHHHTAQLISAPLEQFNPEEFMKKSVKVGKPVAKPSRKEDAEKTVRGFALDAPIKVLAEPKVVKGSKSAAWWAKLAKSKTVGAYVEAVKNDGDALGYLPHYAERKIIAIG